MTKFEYPADLVPHPRFGARSAPSGFEVPRELIRSVFCYDRSPVFPRSAIPADISRQNYTVLPRPCYVDILKQCHRCDRHFIFFAREQQHWFEDLGFWVDAQCIHCTECRRWRHRVRHAHQRFSQAVSKGNWTDEELATLVRDAVFLCEAGDLRNENKLRRLKNLAKARIPEADVTGEIVALVASLRAKREETDY